jgi:alpha-tubulin suppressor-like RCC1 family protein|eukprot:g1458.t1
MKSDELLAPEIVSCSQNHCATVKDGKAYAWAICSNKRGNRFGQLCRPSNKQGGGKSGGIQERKEVDGLGDVVGVAAGGSRDSGHTLFVNLVGQVFACGCDRWQQLGLGSPEAGAVGYSWQGKLWHKRPQHIFALKDVVSVAAGDDHSVALLKSGEVWTWGRGEHGQLGHQGKPFVMPPTKSSVLTDSGDRKLIKAEGNCSATFSAEDGTLLKHVGRCPKILLKRWGVNM